MKGKTMKQYFMTVYLFFGIIFDLGYYFIRSFFQTEKEYEQINHDMEIDIVEDLLVNGK